MTKIAFRLPSADGKVLTMDADTFEAARSPITFAKAKREGYDIRDWPTDFFGKPVSSDALAEHMPEPESGVDPAKQARLERYALLLGADITRAATHDDLMALAASDLDLDTAKAFVRGLPTETATDSNKETAEMNYANVPAGREARALEIRIVGIETRASGGDAAAKAKVKEIRYAQEIARASGKPLHVALAELRIAI